MCTDFTYKNRNCAKTANTNVHEPHITLTYKDTFGDFVSSDLWLQDQMHQPACHQRQVCDHQSLCMTAQTTVSHKLLVYYHQ